MTVNVSLFPEAAKDCRHLQHYAVQVIRDSLPYYPELDGEMLGVRVTHLSHAAAHYDSPGTNYGRQHGIGMPRVVFDAEYLSTTDPLSHRATGCHELGHMMQDRGYGDYPSGEEACDLIWLARAGAAFPKAPSYIPRGPPYKAKWRRHWDLWAADAQDLAQQAWKRRSNGTRQYILWWETRMKRLIRKEQERRESPLYAGRFEERHPWRGRAKATVATGLPNIPPLERYARVVA